MAGSIKYRDGVVVDYFITSAEAITANDIIAVDSSGDGIVADKGDRSKISVIGVATQSVGSTTEFKVKTMGLLDGFSGLTAGTTYYLGDAGAVVEYTALEASDYKVKIGVATATDTIFLDIGGTELSVNTLDASPVGSILDYMGITVPAGWEWVPRATTTVSRTVYAALWKDAFGEVDLFAPDAASATTAEGNGEFHLPTLDDTYTRAGFHGEIATVNTAIDLVTMTDQLGGAIATADYRDGTPVRFIGDDLPGGITAYVTYYITWDGGNSGWKLYTTEADAVGDTGSNQVNLTDQGTGTQIATQYGIALDDAMQQITGSATQESTLGLVRRSDSNATGAFKRGSNVSYSLTGNTGSAGSKLDFDSANSPDARTSNETRPNTGYSSKIIKVAHVLPSGEAVTATKFDTGWISNSDWTNAELTATHNLGAPITELIVNFYISAIGADSDAFSPVIVDNNQGTGSNAQGLSLFYVSDNELHFQTGTNGVPYTDSSGVSQIATNQSYYYRIVVYKPELLQTVKTGTIRTVTDGDWTASSQDATTFLFSTGATDRTLTLPSASSMTAQEITVKKIDSGTGKVTIDGNGVETIDGETTKGLYTQYSYMTLISDGSGWQVSNFYHAPFVGTWTSPTNYNGLSTTITHGLGSNLADLDVRLLFSSDGTEGNAFEIPIADFENGSSHYRGVKYAQSTTDAITFITSGNGVPNVLTTATEQGIPSTYSYKFVIKRKVP